MSTPTLSPTPAAARVGEDLTATDALLSMAAAVTPAELHAAHLALIATGHQVLTEPDTADLHVGAGTAGQTLLGGPRPGPWPVHMSCAKRAYRLVSRGVTAVDPW
ncbi:hypothetical protein ACTHAM_002383 [Cellulomonas soli]|uniref:hypothetical protein n=1 Tax=Cellulomonas soli TaxID=931535 RepID=UPI003F865781